MNENDSIFRENFTGVCSNNHHLWSEGRTSECYLSLDPVVRRLRWLHYTPFHIKLPTNNFTEIFSVVQNILGEILLMMTSSNENIFPRYWPFVRGIHRSPVNSPNKGQWHIALMSSLFCAWINGWGKNHEGGDLRCHHANYDVTVMLW